MRDNILDLKVRTKCQQSSLSLGKNPWTKIVKMLTFYASILLLYSVVTSTEATAAAAAAAAPRKNILFLVGDDMRPNLGVYDGTNSDFYKAPPMHTPNLDALAGDSLLFDRAYANIALCSPTYCRG